MNKIIKAFLKISYLVTIIWIFLILILALIDIVIREIRISILRSIIGILLFLGWLLIIYKFSFYYFYRFLKTNSS